MHEIAIATSIALAILKLPTTRLPEIGDRRELRKYGSPRIPPLIEVFIGFACRLLRLEANVNISNQMIANIVANYEFFNLAILGG